MLIWEDFLIDSNMWKKISCLLHSPAAKFCQVVVFKLKTWKADLDLDRRSIITGRLRRIVPKSIATTLEYFKIRGYIESFLTITIPKSGKSTKETCRRFFLVWKVNKYKTKITNWTTDTIIITTLTIQILSSKNLKKNYSIKNYILN